jgi:hypothetical protein
VQNVSSAAVGVLRGEIQVAKRKGYAQQALENAQRAASIAVVSIQFQSLLVLPLANPHFVFFMHL